MVRHTMPRSDNGATGLLVGMLSLEIVEGDFYTAGSVEATVN